MPLSYDRRAPAELLAALDRGGFAHSLVQNARGGRGGIDLQLRGYAGKTPHWASLYAGLTKLLDLRYAPGRGYYVDTEEAFKKRVPIWSRSWEQWCPEAKIAAFWPQLDEFLDQLLVAVETKFAARDGSLHGVYSAFGADDYALIDREAALAFSNQSEKHAVCHPLTDRLMAALADPPIGAAWSKTATVPKGDCDALGVSSDGALLAIAIRAGSDVAGCTWAPLQMTHAADLFADWVETTRDSTRIIAGMLEQRIRLGISPDLGVEIVDPLRVRPVVLIGKPVSPNALTRLRAVQERLVDRGVGYADLEVWAANLAGRVERIPL